MKHTAYYGSKLRNNCIGFGFSILGPMHLQVNPTILGPMHL